MALERRSGSCPKRALTWRVVALWLWVQVVKSQSTTLAPESVAAQTCVAVTSRPQPQVGLYALNNRGSGETCVLAQFSAYLKVEHERYVALRNGTVNETISKCDKPNGSTSHLAKLAVDFECGHQICLTIAKDDESQTTHLASLDGLYKISDSSYVTFSNSTLGNTIRTTEPDHYYRCKAEQAIVLDYHSLSFSDGNLLFMSNLSLEAFRGVNAPNQSFHMEPETCILDHTQMSSNADIGILVCLVALAVVVLAAYLINYRRKKMANATPYQAM